MPNRQEANTHHEVKKAEAAENLSLDQSLASMKGILLSAVSIDNLETFRFFQRQQTGRHTLLWCKPGRCLNCALKSEMVNSGVPATKDCPFCSHCVVSRGGAV